jgi:cytochrome c peroxidase
MIATARNKGLFVAAAIALGSACFSFLPSDEQELPASSIALGEKLFFDPILSSDKTVSCGSCHKKEFAFADNTPVSLGVGNKRTTRNTPSVMYMTRRVSFFWDGRAKTLEEQALIPLTNPDEMNMTEKEAVRRLTSSKYYKEAFQKVFHTAPNIRNLCVALADFQKSLQFYESRYDQYLKGNDSALNESEINGMTTFFFKGQCVACHIGDDFTNDELRNIGLFNKSTHLDVGRFKISNDTLDLGKFKTPHLRNVELTAPYMHDGSMKTLRDVINFYDDPEKHVSGIVNMDTTMGRIGKLELSEQEMIELEAFLKALTDVQYTKKH